MEKKLKWITLLFTALFLGAGLSNALNTTVPSNGETKGFSLEKKHITLHFLKPSIQEKTSFLGIEMKGTNTYLYTAGEPMLPLYTTTLSFPFGTKIISIECKPSEVKNLSLSSHIIPAPQSIVHGTAKNSLNYEMDDAIYSTNTFYPGNWYTHYTGGGLDQNGDRKTFLTLRVYPLLYNPVTDIVTYTNNLNLTITYKEPKSELFPIKNEYDLVIITPSTLYDNRLHQLMEHKNNQGVSTIIQTLENIYSNYSGVDKPEQIKYFIKDAIETWGVKYVLLVGGLKSLIYGKSRDDANQGTKDWYLPVRYTNLNDGPMEPYDPGFISDLYYADIYDSEGNFSSWDSNGDGIFASWSRFSGRDTLDFYPDVYVGRLPCRNIWEVKIMVNKILTYETTTSPDSPWYKRLVAVAGDAFDDPPDNFYEGETACEKVITTYMTEFEPIRLFGSNQNIDPDYTPETFSIIREITRGCGHLYFEGHANPFSWTTHAPGNFDEYFGGITIYNFPLLANKDKYPICIVVGCHNSQFNLTLFSSMRDRTNSHHMWSYGVPVPECWSWWLTRKIGGGSIATIGCTGLGPAAIGENGDQDGDGINEPDCDEKYSSYMGIQFYKSFYEGYDILGETWGYSIKKYLDTYPGMSDQQDAKMAEQWALLGDPSLQIGG